MKIILLFIFFIAAVHFPVFAQSVLQTLKGKVFDADTGIPLPGATVSVMEAEYAIGTATDSEGYFRIEKVPVGRYDIKISYIGFEPYLAREVVVGSGKEVVLNIGLKESVEALNEITVQAWSDKSRPVNTMATLSARQVSMEEAGRYAGGFDDPARLVSAYAGVASTVGNNGIVIRGNSPKGLLWRMEGVQISNPNHFADYVSLGGGAVTALSSQTMGTSDFLTGAFPAEYGNALSGVFDINLRTGNTDKREYVFQAGAVGIDFAAEGPFKKGKRSSYLFNYRYSTLGLLAPLLPDEMGKLTYQDLSFKLNFPTKAGIFSLWGIGAYDFQGNDAVTDPDKWEKSSDREEFETKLTLGAIGLGFKKIIGNNTFIQTTVAATENSLNWKEWKLDDQIQLQPERSINDFKWNYTITGFVNHKFGAQHTNRTGITFDRKMFDILIKNSEEENLLQTTVSEKRGANLLQFYTQSKIKPANSLEFNLGVHSQYFTLNGNYTIEPRIGVSWNLQPRQTIAAAYGLHSQLERIQLFLIRENTQNGIQLPNKKLDFNKAHHFVISYEFRPGKHFRLKIEPYYQYLFDIPVVPGSYISTINLNDIWDFNKELENEGTGKNVGLDLTVERFLHKGWYYLLTASVFDSKYKGGDQVERNTRYNRNYVFNALGGKEWQTGKEKRNLLNANIRFSFLGGNRIIPLDITATYNQKRIIEDVSRAYEHQLPDESILSLSFSYRKNKPEFSSIWSFHLINALGSKVFQEYEFNKEENKIEKIEDLIFVPNISYKIEF